MPSSDPSSTMAFSTVRYRLQTLILDDLDARTTGAGSGGSLVPSAGGGGGVTSGKTVERASGRRRVRNSVDACR